MPLTILASVSLLALVVTGRPLLPQDTPQLVQPSGEVQDAVQAIFESRLGSGYLNSGDDDENVEAGVQVRLATSESQSAYLSQLASDNVKLILPLGDNPLAPSSNEKTLYDALEGLDELDGGTRPLEEVLSDYDGEKLEVEEEYPSVVSSPQYAQPLVLTLVFCAVSLFIAFCVGLTLYVWEIFRYDVFSKRLIWDLLPRIEENLGVEGGGGGGRVGYKEKPMILDVEVVEEVTEEKVEVIRTIAQSRSRESLFEDATSSIGDDDDDCFEDATEPSDPGLPPLPSASHSPARGPLQMREAPSNPPTWSTQASESPSLSLDPPLLHRSLELECVEPPARRRAYRDPISEVDTYLALQMLPAFGGADAAWLVRFMMGIFGWLSVFVSGGRREETRRLIQG